METREKTVSIFACIIGLIMVFIGMVKDQNVIFAIGILFIIFGYLIIRRNLKKTNVKKGSQKS